MTDKRKMQSEDASAEKALEKNEAAQRAAALAEVDQQAAAPESAVLAKAPAKPAAPAKAGRSAKSAKGGAKKTTDKETARQILFETSEDRSVIAAQASADSVILATLIENLSGAQRRVRQFSAATINEISAQQPALLLTYIDDIADALHRPEAQTRWECLEALSNLVCHDPEACEQALHGAEISLYDEGSGTARLAALRFLCAYGAQDARRAQKVWSLIDEAIQCYHGDPEFQDMLISVEQFAEGKIGKTVKAALASRMDFDAKHSKGSLGTRAKKIVEICQ